MLPLIRIGPNERPICAVYSRERLVDSGLIGWLNTAVPVAMSMSRTKLSVMSYMKQNSALASSVNVMTWRRFFAWSLTIPHSGIANIPTSTGRDISMPICVLFMPISS